MIDTKDLRENPKKSAEKAFDKGIKVDVDKILLLDKQYRALRHEVQILHEERNKIAKERNVKKGKEVKEKLSVLEKKLAEAERSLNSSLWLIPNPAKDDVKVGKNETENETIRSVGEKTKFSFKVRDHLEIGEILDGIDVKSAAKVSGTRFGYLKNDVARLELALIQYSADFLTEKGFSFIIPPSMISLETMKALGYTEQGGIDDMYVFEKDSMVLVGTAEHSLVPMHKDKMLNKNDFPMRYVGFSPAFRREAGSYGKDTRGIFRVHEFHKVEMVSFVEEGKDDEEHDLLLSIEEELFSSLTIPYRVVKMCTGDLGFPVARKYDIEAWIPSQEKYREVTSVSTVTDFQSRRLNMRYKDRDETKFTYVLNGTAFAIGRTIIAILENFQQEDGSVVIPEVLRKYINIDKIIPKSS